MAIVTKSGKTYTDDFNVIGTSSHYGRITFINSDDETQRTNFGLEIFTSPEVRSTTGKKPVFTESILVTGDKDTEYFHSDTSILKDRKSQAYLYLLNEYRFPSSKDIDGNIVLGDLIYGSNWESDEI